MRGRTWLTCLALVGVIASVGCEPLFTGIEIESCGDIIYGCDGPTSTGEPGPTKRLRVTTVTTGTPLDSTVWYSLEITSPGGLAAFSWHVAQNHTEVLAFNDNVSIGTDHSVALSDVPTHCEVQGENPRTVSIPTMTLEEFQASPVETTFEVICS
jgi:hypothetical protein